MIKTLSAITASYIFVTYWLSTIYDNTFMSMFLSAGLAPGIVKLALISSLIYLIVKKSFPYKLTNQLMVILGVGFVSFGLVGVFSLDIERMTYPFLMSMDYLTLAEIGVLFTLAGLTYPYQSAQKALRKPAIINLRTAQLRLVRTQQALTNVIKDDLPVTAPTSLSRRHTRPAN